MAVNSGTHLCNHRKTRILPILSARLPLLFKARQRMAALSVSYFQLATPPPPRPLISRLLDYFFAPFWLAQALLF
jgi:hypothetical protein